MYNPEFNKKILALAPKFDTKEVAPSTFETLLAHSSTGARFIVWSGASEHTIYGNAAVNWAFRAWHDALHIKLQAPFSPLGETLVALEQCRLIGSDNAAKLIWSEVVGQVEYYEQHGTFPINQVEYIKSYLTHLK